MALVVISTDAYVGPDGVAGWAFVSSNGAQERGALPLGTASHLAEWQATARALAWALQNVHAPDTVELRTDSALVAKGLASRRPAMHGEAAVLRAECRRALAALGQVGVRARVERVPREQNAAADELSRSRE